MAEKACIKRLQKEFRDLCKEPVPLIVARPSPNNILEWYYVLEGSEGTPFAGGYYLGRITFPSEYPFKPPSIRMTTPSGRFMTDTKICLSMSDFHPESWNPMWSVSSILTGLLSFMMDKSPTTGSVSSTDEEKQCLAKASLAFNCKIPAFRKLFPEYVEKHNQKLAELAQLEASKLAAQEVSSSPLKSETHNNNMQVLEGQAADTRNNRKPSIPTWLLLLLFSVFGLVMSLPFLER